MVRIKFFGGCARARIRPMRMRTRPTETIFLVGSELRTSDLHSIVNLHAVSLCVLFIPVWANMNFELFELSY